jgi:hypothetical protein
MHSTVAVPVGGAPKQSQRSTQPVSVQTKPFSTSAAWMHEGNAVLSRVPIQPHVAASLVPLAFRHGPNSPGTTGSQTGPTAPLDSLELGASPSSVVEVALVAASEGALASVDVDASDELDDPATGSASSAQATNTMKPHATLRSDMPTRCRRAASR